MSGLATASIPSAATNHRRCSLGICVGFDITTISKVKLSDTEALSADLYHYPEEIMCQQGETAKSPEMIEEFVRQNLRSCRSSTISPPRSSGRSLPGFTTALLECDRCNALAAVRAAH
jgi:hypothetical protein